MKKLKSLGVDGDAYDEANRKALEEVEKKLTPEELSILQTLKGRRMVRPEDSLNMDNFTLDSIDGRAPRLERGKLGLTAARKAQVKYTTHDPLSFLNGEARAASKAMKNGYIASSGGKTMNGHHGINGDKPTNGENGHMMTKNGTDATTVGGLIGTEDSLARLAPLDEASRHRVISQLHGAAEDLETPYDTMVRFVNAVSALVIFPQRNYYATASC